MYNIHCVAWSSHMKKQFNTIQKLSQNNNKPDIFLDIDGVIADFEAHLDSQNKREDNGRIKWNELDHDWFSSIPIYEGAQEFHKDLSKIGKVRFLTAPTLSAGCFSGKAAWISEKFLPQSGKYALSSLMIIAKKDKQLAAAPGRILIDDTEENIDRWIEAGGIGIHHQGDFEKTLQAVRDALDDQEQHPILNPEVQ